LKAPLLRYRTSDVLYYHVHLPKTGGTTTSNMILTELCGDSDGHVKAYDWDRHCKISCEHAMVDTEISCIQGKRWEHAKWNRISEFVIDVKKSFPIRKVVYITTLRRGSKRVVSHWAQEMQQLKIWQPPPNVPRVSNESFLLYLLGANWTNKWPGVEANSVSQRNNFQVASLASVPDDMEVTSEHLEEAKERLKTGSWIIGFTDCLDRLRHRLWTLGNHDSTLALEALPHLQHRTPSAIQFNETVMDELEKQCRFDNELYAWAWEQSTKDQRFVSCT